MSTNSLSPGDLRAALARLRPPLPIYQLAAVVRMHPATLSAVLNERRPLAPDCAERIMRAITETEARRTA